MKHLMMALCFVGIFFISNENTANCEEIDISGYNQCIEKDSSTFGMIECATEATKFWDKKLNTVYKKLMSLQENQEKKKSLKNTQLSWIRYRDQMSSLYMVLEGGTMAQLNGDVWYMEATKAQVKFLESFLPTE